METYSNRKLATRHVIGALHTGARAADASAARLPSLLLMLTLLMTGCVVVTIPSVSNGTFTGSWQGVTAPPTESSRSRDSTIWCYASTTGEYSSRAHGLMVGSRESCARRPAGRRGGAENCRKNDNMNLPKHNAKDIFAEALRFANAAERAAYLDRTCAGDPALRQEVESLFGAYAQAGDFLRPTISILEPDPAPEHAGTRIGRYKLLEQIG